MKAIGKIEWATKAEATKAVKDMRRLAAPARARIVNKIEQYAADPASLANNVCVLPPLACARLRRVLQLPPSARRAGYVRLAVPDLPDLYALPNAPPLTVAAPVRQRHMLQYAIVVALESVRDVRSAWCGSLRADSPERHHLRRERKLISGNTHRRCHFLVE